MKRTVCIGDLHGCRQETEALLAKLDLQPEDKLVFLGDLIDRGPDSPGCVRLVRGLAEAGRAVCILGNHDEKAVRYRKHADRAAADPKYKNPMGEPLPKRLAEWMALSLEDLAFLASCPIVYRPLPGWIAVHGGLVPGILPEKQKPGEVIRTRWVSEETHKYVGLKGNEDSPDMPAGAIPWMDAWDGTDSVVYGHAVHSEELPHVVTRPNGAQCWGIDTGGVFGGRLTALVLETREVFQVQVLEKYSPPGWVSVNLPVRSQRRGHPYASRCSTFRGSRDPPTKRSTVRASTQEANRYCSARATSVG